MAFRRHWVEEPGQPETVLPKSAPLMGALNTTINGVVMAVHCSTLL